MIDTQCRLWFALKLQQSNGTSLWLQLVLKCSKPHTTNRLGINFCSLTFEGQTFICNNRPKMYSMKEFHSALEIRRTNLGESSLLNGWTYVATEINLLNASPMTLSGWICTHRCCHHSPNVHESPEVNCASRENLNEAINHESRERTHFLQKNRNGAASCDSPNCSELRKGIFTWQQWATPKNLLVNQPHTVVESTTTNNIPKKAV